MKSVALALGGGGARGLAHIVIAEALDEMGVKPVAIAGTSIGAIIGAGYAAGMSGKEMRRYAIHMAHNRTDIMRRMMRARAGKLSAIFGGLGDATRLDAELLCQEFLPESLPEDFSGLSIPLTVIASDLYRRCEVTFSDGPLRRALAASISLPTIMRPVEVDGAVLVDGGATNPLPFEHLRGRADVVVAVEISGPISADDKRDVPNALECLYATVLVMTHSIISEKLRHGAPDLLVQPKVGSFRALGFMQASAILRAADPVKAEFKENLSRLLEA
jgi:NTE family protein